MKVLAGWLFDRTGSPTVKALGKAALAQVERVLGNHESAEQLLSEAIPVARKISSMWILSNALPALSRLSRTAGDLEAAEDAAFEELEMASASSSKLWAVDALELAAGTAVDRESYQRAARLFGAAQSIRDEIGYARYPFDSEQFEVASGTSSNPHRQKVPRRTWKNPSHTRFVDAANASGRQADGYRSHQPRSTSRGLWLKGLPIPRSGRGCSSLLARFRRTSEKFLRN
jgi:hypothetical protein